MRFGDGHEPLTRKKWCVLRQGADGECMRTGGCTEKTREYNLMGDQKTGEYEVTGARKKIDAYKLADGFSEN